MFKEEIGGEYVKWRGEPLKEPRVLDKKKNTWDICISGYDSESNWNYLFSLVHVRYYV